MSSHNSIPTSVSMPMTLPPPSSAQPSTTYSPATAAGLSKTPSMGKSSSTGSMSRITSGPDSQVLHDTLNVINEHITDLSATARSNGGLHVPPDSASEYSSHVDHRLSYIQGEETDEEEQGLHARPDVESWSADDVAEHLFALGVEKHHCEVFRVQEITGEVLLGMDQTSLFIKALELGSVGRRLKTWQKIKNLQDQVSGLATATRRTSEVGSDGGGARARSRNNTLTTPAQRLPPIEDRPGSVQSKRLSAAEAQQQGTSPLSPPCAQDSPTRPHHEKRPSAASIRELRPLAPPLVDRLPLDRDHPRRAEYARTLLSRFLMAGRFPRATRATGSKLPSTGIGRWGTLLRTTVDRFRQDGAGDTMMGLSSSTLQEPPDLDRGYFSGTEVDRGRRDTQKWSSKGETASSPPIRETPATPRSSASAAPRPTRVTLAIRKRRFRPRRVAHRAGSAEILRLCRRRSSENGFYQHHHHHLGLGPQSARPAGEGLSTPDSHETGRPGRRL